MSDLNPYEEGLANDLAKAQARIEELEKERDRVAAINVNHCRTVNTYVVDNARLADRAEAAEAKLTKCEALMHAGLAEYQRRLVGVIKASIAARSAQKTYFKDRSKDNLIASKQAEIILDKLLAELEGELDD